MGEARMELGEREFEKIGDYVKAHLKQWVSETGAAAEAGGASDSIVERATWLRERELDLVERVVRVEEELKNLREVMEERFQKVDERFEAQRELMNERFDHMVKRTSFSQWIIGISFTAVGVLMLVLNYFG